MDEGQWNQANKQVNKMEVESRDDQNGRMVVGFVPFGRHVGLGDLYEYSTDTIFNRNNSLWLDMHSSVKTDLITNPNVSHTFFFNQPELCKWIHLGIDHHQQSTMVFSENLSGRARARYWFSDYIDYRPPENCVSIVVHFCIRDSKSSLSSSTNLPNECRATHMVKQIVYGANALLILEQQIGNSELRQVVENRLFLAAKCLVANREISSKLLNSVQCHFYSDLPSLKPLLQIPLIDFYKEKLPAILGQMKNPKLQVPVYAILVPLPNCQLGTCWKDQRLVDTTLMFTILQHPISTFRNDCKSLLDDPFIQRIHRMRHYLEHFLDYLEKLCNKISTTLSIGHQVYDSLCQFWQTYFASGIVTEWLIWRKMGMSIMKRLLNDIELPFEPMASIVNLGGMKKIFIFKTSKAPDELFEKFRMDLNLSQTPEWSVLNIVSASMEHIESTREKLEAFIRSDDKSIKYFISSSSVDEDGTILTLNPERTTSIQPFKSLPPGNPITFHLQTDRRSDGDFNWLEFGVKTSAQHRTILFIGAAGCGKTTLVDSIINYILGVQWTDSFRFRIERGNSSITAYTIHYVNGMLNIPYSLTIIDTPGYCGDLEKDRRTSQLVAKFLAHGNSRNVDIIGLVANSNEKVLSNSHNNVLKAIPVIFGGDNIPNIHWFCTFCSQLNKSPIVLEGVGPSSGISTEFYYQFDNTALFSSNQQQIGEFDKNQKRWKVVWDNLQIFFNRLADSQFVPKSTPWSTEQLASLGAIKVMENDIEDLLDRIEKLYNKKPELANIRKMIKPEIEEGQYKLCMDLIKLMEETAVKIKQLKDSGFKSDRHVRRFRFRKNTAKASDYVRYLKALTNPSPLRCKILDQIDMWSYNVNNNNKNVNLSFAIQQVSPKIESNTRLV